MRITIGVTSLDEALALIDSGADELYLGYVPTSWSDSFGTLIWPNRRPWKKANISKKSDLAMITAHAMRNRVKVFVTLNEAYSCAELESFYRNIIQDCEDSGVHGYIVGDLSILFCITEIASNKEL